MTSTRGKGLVGVFVVFACGYLLSSLLRGVTAALAPVLRSEFQPDPAQLGLLGGAYFAAFAVLQLPMGAWLDKYGVRTVLTFSLGVAAISCFAFATAGSFSQLVAARVLTGAGVSACLVAPLTAARLWTSSSAQQRINALMLTSGALGLVLGTLPAEGIATTLGWRWLFVALGVLLLCVASANSVLTPRHGIKTTTLRGTLSSYRQILKGSYMFSIGPLGMFNYAVLVAVQTLWAGPWLTTLGRLSSREAATRLMCMNGIMLVVFFVMGMWSPKIIKSAEDCERILVKWTPLSILLLGGIALLGTKAGWLFFAAYSVAAWPLSVTHPLVGQRFSADEAGRAIAFFNLLLFAGVFFWQWGFGLALTRLGPVLGTADAYRVAMAALAMLSLMGYLAFLSTIRRAGVTAATALEVGEA